MQSIVGKGAIVFKIGALTHMKPCVVEKYCPNIKKYEVNFDGPWVGYYTKHELLIDKE